MLLMFHVLNLYTASLLNSSDLVIFPWRSVSFLVHTVISSANMDNWSPRLLYISFICFSILNSAG